MSLAFLFHYFMLSVFRMLIHPSSGACDLFFELFRGLYCSGTMCAGVTLWFSCGGVVSLCRLKHCFSLHKDTTPPQPNHITLISVGLYLWIMCKSHWLKERGNLGNDNFFISTDIWSAVSLQQGQGTKLLKFYCRSLSLYSKFEPSEYEERVTDISVSPRRLSLLKFGVWQELWNF